MIEPVMACDDIVPIATGFYDRHCFLNWHSKANLLTESECVLRLGCDAVPRNLKSAAGCSFNTYGSCVTTEQAGGGFEDLRKTPMKKNFKTEITEAISIDESKRMIELEIIIKDGLHSFLKVADALAEINESRLYRADYKTFEEYVEKRWDFKKRRAYQLIEAGKIHKSLPANVQDSCTNSEQLTELGKVPENKRVKVVKAAIKAAGKNGKKLSSTDIKEAAIIEVGPAIIESETDDVPPHDDPPDELETKLLPPAVNPLEEVCRKQEEDLKRLQTELAEAKTKVVTVNTVTATEKPMTPLLFLDSLLTLEKRIPNDTPQSERAKYGAHANALASRLLNPVKKAFSPYTR